MIPDRSDVVRALEAEGFFERARTGDKRGASLFARLAAYRMNPTGDRSSFGWLRKGGGTMVDGYAEDAIVYGDGPTTNNNVVDMVVGAGAPGASIGWQIKPRRVGVDVWEAPRDLTPDEYAYLGGRPTVGTGGAPPPPPPAATTCRYEAAAIAKLTADISALRNDIAHYRGTLDALTALAARLDESWAARVWAASDPASAEVVVQIDEDKLPTYEGRIFGQRVTLRPVK